MYVNSLCIFEFTFQKYDLFIFLSIMNLLKQEDKNLIIIHQKTRYLINNPSIFRLNAGFPKNILRKLKKNWLIFSKTVFRF